MRTWAQRIIPSRLVSEWCERKAAQRYALFSSLDPQDYPTALESWYRQRTGLALDLGNPQTYDEKLQWIKLYAATPLTGRLSDKYLVRPWVAQRVGDDVLVPLFGVFDDADDIDFGALPDQFVLKATHGSGWNIIVRDKASFDSVQAREQLKGWLARDYAFVEGLELQYRYCEPRIIAEAYLENALGDLPDYKFFCFKGRVACVGYVRGRHGDSQEACFDASWNKLPCTYYTHSRIQEEVPRPAGFERALEIAETLAAGFEHVRVDLYILDDGSVYFGEMTFTTCSGICSWDPPEYNKVFGELIDLDAYPAWRAQQVQVDQGEEGPNASVSVCEEPGERDA